MSGFTTPDPLGDGEQIVFSHTTIRDLPDSFFKLWLLDDAQGVRPFREVQAHHVTTPVWSPDGTMLVYGISYDDGRVRTDYQLFDMRTLAERTIVTNSHSDFAPKWSPDGRYLACLAREGASPFQLHVVDIGSGETTRLPVSALDHCWSDDSWSLIALTLSPDGSRTFVRCDVAGGQIAWSGGADHLGRAECVALAPGGRAVAYLKPHDQREEVTVLNVAALDGQTRMWTAALGCLLAWSPDAAQLVFLDAGARQSPGKFTIWDSSSGDMRSLAVRLPREHLPAGVTWSPDGTRLAFNLSSPENTSRIVVANAQGGDQRQVVASTRGLIHEIAWRPRPAGSSA